MKICTLAPHVIKKAKNLTDIMVSIKKHKKGMQNKGFRLKSCQKSATNLLNGKRLIQQSNHQ